MGASDRYYSWLDPSVAPQMRHLALSVLNRQGSYRRPPFKHFLQAMRRVNGSSLVDAGCGIGHYSEMLYRHHPGIQYTGFDFSIAMVKEAKRLWPGREFLVADMTEFDYSPYDIVLASSLIEVMDDWVRGVDALCKTTQGSIILSRVQLRGGKTIRQNNPGYGGQLVYAHVHNEKELLSSFRERGFKATWSVHWSNFRPLSATYILER